MSTELARFNFEITSLKEAMDYAKMIADSDLAPKDYKGKPGNVLIAMQYGFEIGLKPMQAIQNIAVINGRPAVWGDAMIGLIQGHPLCEYIKEDIKDDIAYCIVKRVGHDEHISKFSKADAKAAGLLNKPGPWSQYTDRMLKMRARGFALRDKFSDILKGIAMREEVMDYVEFSDDKNGLHTQAKNNVIQLIEGKKNENQLDIIKNIIEHAHHVDGLCVVPELAKNLTEEDKIIIRKLYSEKKAQLDQKDQENHAHDDCNGEDLYEPEIEDSKPVESATFTEYEKVKKALLNAKSKDTLDIAADLIGTCETAEQHDELLAIYNKRKTEVK